MSRTIRLVTAVAASMACTATLAVLHGCPSSSSTPASSSGNAASSSAADTSATLARIGDTKLTVAQLQKKLDDQSPFVRARYAAADKKQEFLDAQVRFEVLAAEAFARGLDRDPEVRDAVKKIIVQKLTRDEFDGRVKLSDVSDADLQGYFDAHKSDYEKPEQARASVVTIAFGGDKAAAKKKAVDVQKRASDPARLPDRAAFKDLVLQNSTDDAEKAAGGDLRYLSQDEVTAKLGNDAAAWLFGAEELDAVSPVLEGNNAFVVVKRTGKRKAVTRTFEQVKNQIKNVVYREKRTASFNAYVDELKQKFHVELSPEHLVDVKVDATPPALGPGPLDDAHGGHTHDGHDAADDDGAPAATPPAAPAAPAGAAAGPASTDARAPTP